MRTVSLLFILASAAAAASVSVHVKNCTDEEESPRDGVTNWSLLQVRGFPENISLMTASENSTQEDQQPAPLCSLNPRPPLDLPPPLYIEIQRIRRSTHNINSSAILCGLVLVITVARQMWFSLLRPPLQRLPLATPLKAETLLPAAEHLLRDLVSENHQGTFLISVDNRKDLSYACLREFLESGQSDVSCFGCGQEDRLALLVGSGPEVPVALLALSAQCSVMPLDPRLKEEELMFAISDLPAKAIVSLAQRAPLAETVPVISLCPDEVVAGLYTLKGNRCPKPLPQTPESNSVALLLHTSGTTKKPKLVPLTHANLVTGALCTRHTLELSPQDRCLNMLPLYHIGGISCNILCTAASSASVVCAPHFNAQDATQWMQCFQPTWYYATPSIHQLLMAQPHELRTVGLKFVRNASAALLPSIAVRMQEAFGCIILPTYGMTECVPICSHRRSALVQIASVGPPAGPEVRISDEGEILVRGPGVMKGYEVDVQSDTDPNLEAFVDGKWFRTGDMGNMAADGYIYISGRSKEIINRGGEKISPFQVEDSLRDARVAEMVAFPLPHKELGEEVAIAVKLVQPNSNLLGLLESLHDRASHNLSEKWLPQVLVEMDEIPRTKAGKIARVGLAARLGVPQGSVAYAGRRVYSFRDGNLTDVAQAVGPAPQIDSLGLLRQAGDNAMPTEQLELVGSLYAVTVFLIVTHHQVWSFSDTITLPFMPPWAIAFLEVTTRTVGTRWRLLIIVICAALLNGKVLNSRKTGVMMMMYFALLWPIKPMSEWLSSAITGYDSCTANVGYRYFLPILVVAEVLLARARRLPLPWLQCLAAFTMAVVWRICFGRQQSLPVYIPWWLQEWLEKNWSGTHNALLYVAVYLTVGHYGQPVFARFMTYWATKSRAAQCAAARRALVALLSLLAAHVWNSTAFFTYYSAMCNQQDGLPWYNQPMQRALNNMIKYYIDPRTTVGWLSDFVYSLMLLSLLVLVVAPLAPRLSVAGQYAWGIYCAQGLLFYCRGSEGLLSFSITVRGFVLLPRLQTALQVFAGYGCIQLLLMVAYSVVIIVLICLPFQLAYGFLMRCLNTWAAKLFDAGMTTKLFDAGVKKANC